MRALNVHKNIPVSITKLRLGLLVGFISSHLIADKLLPINPRAITGPPKMSLLLEAKSMPELIIKPRFYPCFAHGLPWLVHNVQPSNQKNIYGAALALIAIMCGIMHGIIAVASLLATMALYGNGRDPQ